MPCLACHVPWDSRPKGDPLVFVGGWKAINLLKETYLWLGCHHWPSVLVVILPSNPFKYPYGNNAILYTTRYDSSPPGCRLPRAAERLWLRCTPTLSKAWSCYTRSEISHPPADGEVLCYWLLLLLAVDCPQGFSEWSFRGQLCVSLIPAQNGGE